MNGLLLFSRVRKHFVVAWIAASSILPSVACAADSPVYSSLLGILTAPLPVQAAADSAGNIYLVGQSDSGLVPVTPGSLRASPGGLCGFVIKMNPDASQILYSSLFGCGGTRPTAIAVDASGSAYITGFTPTTNNSNFPIVHPFQSRPTVGQYDAFAIRLSADGSSVVFSTVFGGSSADEGDAIALDGDGNAYIAGTTNSSDFPTRSGLQTSIGSPSVNCELSFNACFPVTDAFVTKISSSGALIYSTYVGGEGRDVANGIAVDSASNAYVTGETNSKSFPTTPGAFISSCLSLGGFPCATHAFAAKLNNAGNGLAYSTLLSQGSSGQGIAVDANHNAFITGSGNQGFATTVPAEFCHGLTIPLNGNCGYAFLFELNANGTAPLYSRLFADSDFRAVAIDAGGNVYLAGGTAGNAFAAAAKLSYPDFTPALTTFGTGFTNSVVTGNAGLVTFAGWTISTLENPSGLNLPCSNIGCTTLFIQGLNSATLQPTPPPIALAQAIANAASGTLTPLSPGEIITVYGSGFGPSKLVKGSPDSFGRVPRMLADTALLIQGVPAPLLYVAPGQLSAIVPDSVANGPGIELLVVYRGSLSGPDGLLVAEASPALFTQDQSGTGPAAILNQDFSLNTLANPAHAGSFIMLYGTGGGLSLGPSSLEGILTPDPPASLKLPVHVNIAGTAADVTYAGGVGGQVKGLIQVNARVPLGIVSQGTQAVPIEIVVGSTHSPAAGVPGGIAKPTTVYVAP